MGRTDTFRMVRDIRDIAALTQSSRGGCPFSTISPAPGQQEL